MVAVEGDTPMLIGRSREHGLGEVMGEFLRGIRGINHSRPKTSVKLS
jgi:hypothetical protein